MVKKVMTQYVNDPLQKLQSTPAYWETEKSLLDPSQVQEITSSAFMTKFSIFLQTSHPLYYKLIA